MTEDQRMESIKGALKTLEDEFLKEPTLFFTEHDIASRCYALIQESLNHETVELKDGKKTYLVHHEYPTPFRCDMEKQRNCLNQD